MSKMVPIDSLAAYFGPGRRTQEEAGTSQLGATLDVLTFLADRAAQMGLFSGVDSCGRMWLDALTTLSVVDHHPHAVVVLAVRSRPRTDGGHKLAGIRAALILHTRGSNEGIERQIQHLLTTYTNTKDSSLTSKTFESRSHFILSDRRLPRWAKITWGAVGNYFVAALGENAFEDVTSLLDRNGAAGTPLSLAKDEWFMSAYDRLARLAQQTGTGHPNSKAMPQVRSIALFMNLKRLCQTVDESLAAKIERMLSALELDQSDSVVWHASRTGRAIEIREVAHRLGEDHVGVLASADLLADLGQNVIPDEARGFGILNLDPKTAFPAACSAYLAARSQNAQESSRAFWDRVKKQSGVSIQEDIVSHLRGPVLVHNYPQHALGLPFAWTIVVPIKGDAKAVRRNIGKLLNHASEMIDPGDIIRVVHREVQGADTPGGLWNVQYGFDGPAVAVTDDWLVLSFSPHAVRANVSLLKSKPQ